MHRNPDNSGWRPSAGMDALRLRARVLAAIRGFFAERGVLEVETPIASRHGTTDPAIDSLTVRYAGPGAPPGGTLYLHTSPEFAMKRLVAAGAGPIYQLCRVFRDGERGRLHNPEFTLLEWYRPGMGPAGFMTETAELLNRLLPTPLPVRPLTYSDAFRTHLGLNPHRAPTHDLIALARRLGIAPAGLDEGDRDPWLHLLLSHAIEPHLGRGEITLLHDYPASQAALARVRPGDPSVAERFEVYLEGMEIANGFHELTDGAEQRRRFEAERARRITEGRGAPPYDVHLVAALEAGFPDCTGAALGVDRLLMYLAGASHIDEVLAFPVERA